MPPNMDLEFRKKNTTPPIAPTHQKGGCRKTVSSRRGFMAEVAARVTQRSGDSGSRMGKETLKESRGASYTHRPLRPPTAKRWRPPLNLHVYHLAWTLSFALRTAPTHQSDARLDPRSPEQVLCSCLCGISQRVCVYVHVLGGLSGVSQCRCVQ